MVGAGHPSPTPTIPEGTTIGKSSTFFRGRQTFLLGGNFLPLFVPVFDYRNGSYFALIFFLVLEVFLGTRKFIVSGWWNGVSIRATDSRTRDTTPDVRKVLWQQAVGNF